MPPGAPTSLHPCRECRAEVRADALTCPQCGAPRPARPTFSGEGYEWKSRGTWLGAPLVHIAFGLDAAGRPRTARGICALGQRAVGCVAIGILANGIFAFGLIACGLFSCGLVAVAAIASLGLNSFAPWPFGLVAIGWHAHGLAAFGWKAALSPSGAK